MLQAGEKIRLLIIDDIPETRENLRKLLSFDASIAVVGAAGSGKEGIELAKQLTPDVILMDINMPDMDGIRATELIIQAVPSVQVVMLSVQGDTDYMRRAMLAGARDFLTKPPSGDELMNTIHRAYEMGKSRVAFLTPAPSSQALAQAPSQKHRYAGEIIAVFSPKGGVGCTTVAVNLAIALQQLSGGARKVALVDSSMQFGDVGVMLNLQPSRSMADLVDQIKDLDNEMLSSVLTAHGSGIKVLLAPRNPEEAEALLSVSLPEDASGGSGAVRAILRQLRESADFIVVDMSSGVDGVALTVFDMSSLIVLVVAPEIPAIKSARLFLEVATKLNYPMDKIALVVNGMDSSSRISVEQIEAAMIPTVARIPLDKRVAVAAANQGVPFVVHDRSSPISQAVMRLAEHVQGALIKETDDVEEEEEAAASSLGLSRLRLGRLFSSSG